MTFFMSHMTILYMYWFITLRAYDIFCIAYDKFDGNNFTIFTHVAHMTFFMSHMTILYMYWFITLRAYDIFASHMINFMEITFLFAFRAYDIFYVAYDNFDRKLNFNVWHMVHMTIFIKDKGGSWGI